MAEKILDERRRDVASMIEAVPMPDIESRRQALRPILSGSGEHAIVVMRLAHERMIVRREEEMGRTPERRDTEYIITLLMPHNCCANMMPITAKMAG